jgi:hypothetical protein
VLVALGMPYSGGEYELSGGRLLNLAEVARTVLWMVSEDSGMLTGSVINYDQSVWAALIPQPVEKL